MNTDQTPRYLPILLTRSSETLQVPATPYGIGYFLRIGRSSSLEKELTCELDVDV